MGEIWRYLPLLYSFIVKRWLVLMSSERGQCRSWVKGRHGQQAGGTAGVPPASEITVRPGTYASCHGTKSLLSSPLRGSKSREAGSRSREASDSFVARSTRSTSVLLAGNA